MLYPNANKSNIDIKNLFYLKIRMNSCQVSKYIVTKNTEKKKNKQV